MSPLKAIALSVCETFLGFVNVARELCTINSVPAPYNFTRTTFSNGNSCVVLTPANQ